LVILDTHGGGFGGTDGVNAEQVGQRTAVHGQALGELEEPDQLEPAQA
jgi:hypothetical protein